VLDSLGVTQFQHEVYLELSRSPEASLATVAVRLGTTRHEVDAALTALKELGLVQRSTLTPSGWRVLAAQVTEIPAALTLSTRIIDVVASAQDEVLAFLVGEVTPQSLEENEQLATQLLERGVLLRFIHLDANVKSPRMRDFITWFTERGGLLRSAPMLPVRLALVDESTAVVASNAQGAVNEGLIVKSPVLLAGLSALFEQYWERATPVSVAAPVAAEPITSAVVPITRQEQNVLTLLGRGMKDSEIAERLELSERTVSRVINQLYERTSSETRFELGMKASRFDWV